MWLRRITSDVLVFSVYRTDVSQYQMISLCEGMVSKGGDFESDPNGFEGWCVTGSRFRD